MNYRLLSKCLMVWLTILIIAIANGVMRETLLVPTLGLLPGFTLSGVLLSLLIIGATYLLLPWIGVQPVRHLIYIGVGWLLLTLLFEFAFGFLQGKPLPVLLEAYTFKDGNIWPVVLLVTACAPFIAGRLRGW